VPLHAFCGEPSGLAGCGTLLVMRDRTRGWWPLVAIVLLLVAVSWVLYAVWQAPNRSDLIT